MHVHIHIYTYIYIYMCVKCLLSLNMVRCIPINWGTTVYGLAFPPTVVTECTEMNSHIHGYTNTTPTMAHWGINVGIHDDYEL